MKLLIVSPYLPHPKSGHGTGVFMYGLLQQIASHHAITLLTFCDKKELELASDVEKLPLKLITVPRGRGARQSMMWNMYLVLMRLFQLCRSIILWQPYYVSKYRHPRMGRMVRELTTEQNFDIVQFEMSQMAQYVPYAVKGKAVLHEHDVSFRPAYREYKAAASFSKKIISYIEWCRWSLYERKMVRKMDRVICVTEQDKMLLGRFLHCKNVSYLPRGVDIPVELPGYSSRDAQSLLFIGAFGHRPNRDAGLWLAGEIFPLVLEKYPACTLYMIGMPPPAELSALTSRMPQLKVLGFVDDITSYLRRCSIFVSPLRFGGGVKVKNLHAMAQGIPVVTTKIGIEGIDGIRPETVLLGDSARKIADQICLLLGDRARAAAIGKNGYDTMRTWYSWKRITADLQNIYEATVHS